MENTEKKLTVTLEGADEEPRVFEELEGVILLLKEEDGVRRIVCGDLSIMGLAAMIQSLYTGDNKIAKELRLAMDIAKLFQEHKDAIEESETDNVNNPFEDLMKTLREKLKGAEA
jgi:hypothetical protein